jgi:methylated-DNA-[protein]-cysteine S-methyltransferase
MSTFLSDISVDTPVGTFHMLTQKQQDTDYIVAAGFGEVTKLQARLLEPLRSVELQSSQPNHPYAKLVQRYFQGDLSALTAIPLIQTGSPFSTSVWNTLRTIAPGETISYTELAYKTGHEGAIRAAGTVCGKNRIILLVPCHRVIKSDGQLGSYLYGPRIKSWLLAHEAKYASK